MKIAIYERPSTLRFSVALEGNFAGSADVENSSDTDTGRIENQDVVDFGDDMFSDDTNWE